MSTLELYERLKPKLGEAEARALLEHIQDVRLGAVAREEFRKELSQVATKADIEALKLEIEAKTEKVKSDVLRWLFALWVAQMGAIIALFFRS